MKDLFFEEFLFCFGNLRKVDILLVLFEILFDDVFGKCIFFFFRFVWLNDSFEKKIIVFYIFLK